MKILTIVRVPIQPGLEDYDKVIINLQTALKPLEDDYYFLVIEDNEVNSIVVEYPKNVELPKELLDKVQVLISKEANNG